MSCYFMKKTISKKIVAGVITLCIMVLLILSAGTDSKAYYKEGDKLTDDGFYYRELSDGTIAITDYEFTSANPVIPDTIDGKPVTAIDQNSFIPPTEEQEKIKSITLPDTLTRISNTAFSSNAALTYVYIPDSVEIIGYGAFQCCSSLRKVHLPKNLNSFGYSVFSSSDNLTEMELSDECQTYKVVGDALYSKDEKTLIYVVEGLKGSFDVPENVTSIRKRAFSGINLTGVNISKNVEEMTGDAFFGSEVTDITVDPENTHYKAIENVLYTWDMSHLMYCGVNKEGMLIVPEGVKVIDENAFEDAKISNIVLPDTLTTIESHAFYGTGRLTGVTIPPSVTSIADGSFSYYTSYSQYLLVTPGSEAETHAIENSYNYVYNNLNFVDVGKYDFFHDAVIWACQTDPRITQGVNVDHFKPYNKCTRAQMIMFLWNSMGCPEPEETNNPFTDVKETDFYFKAVLWAKEKNITSGKTADRFAPQDICTRGQFVIFFWRACGSKYEYIYDSDNIIEFSDVPARSELHAAVVWAQKHYITSGVTPTEFRPSSTINRAQAVTFLFRGNSRIKNARNKK